jgi:hypothetical protein
MLDPAELDDVIVIVAATYWVTVISQCGLRPAKAR